MKTADLTVRAYRPLRLLLIGAPGSGKGTQSARILKDFSLPSISSGDLLRRHLQLNTQIGQEASSYMSQGRLVPDDTMVSMIGEELKQFSIHDNWLLDGFPRTVAQARRLDSSLVRAQQPLNMAIHLDVSPSVILQRILDRWIHIPSGRVYNLSYNPPKVPGKDDVTGEPLSKRPDDDPTVFERRLAQYREATEPLLDYYGGQGILSTLQGSTSDEIYPEIQSLLVAHMNSTTSDATSRDVRIMTAVEGTERPASSSRTSQENASHPLPPSQAV